jgi:hypothetical protein
VIAQEVRALRVATASLPFIGFGAPFLNTWPDSLDTAKDLPLEADFPYEQKN